MLQLNAIARSSKKARRVRPAGRPCIKSGAGRMKGPISGMTETSPSFPRPKRDGLGFRQQGRVACDQARRYEHHELPWTLLIAMRDGSRQHAQNRNTRRFIELSRTMRQQFRSDASRLHGKDAERPLPLLALRVDTIAQDSGA